MTASSAPRIVLLFGPPGAGKGTQATLLAERFGFTHVESSKILEVWMRNDSAVEIEGERYEAEAQRKLWESGVLLPPPLVAHLLKEEVRRVHANQESIITSGAFRTLYEAESVFPLAVELFGRKNIRVVLLRIDPEETQRRNAHRRICALMRHSILHTQETETLMRCPLDGSELLRRKGLDDPNTIRVRLREYADRTQPAIEYLRSQGTEVREVDGDRSVADVFREIEQILA